MPAPLAPAPTRWYATSYFRIAAIVLATLCVLVEGYLSVFVRGSDFDWHLALGRFFLEGDPFRQSHDWYPVGRTMMDAGLALLNLYVARGLVFVSSVALLVWTLEMWCRMANRRIEVSRPVAFAASAFTVALLSAYVLRDLNECGLQLVLLFFLTAAVYALHRGRAAATGFWLALAVTYKTTPIIFLPFLIWKRRLRAAAWTALFAVLLNLAPAFYLGWDMTLRCNQKWFARIYASSQLNDPSQNTIEEAKHHNQGLQASLARLVQTHPAGHPLHLEDPRFFQFGSLEPETLGA